MRRQGNNDGTEVQTEVEKNGKWVLGVDGVVDPASVEELRRASKAKLEEFRNTNVALLKERDELERRLERSDSEQVRAVARRLGADRKTADGLADRSRLAFAIVNGEARALGADTNAPPHRHAFPCPCASMSSPCF
jgi:hypothetical protein